MGFLQTSDDLMNNVNKATKDILDSKFTQFITGAGVPVLVDYYSINETMSTANPGMENLDSIIGDDSPLRYNRIKNFPIYGLREMIPSKDEIDMGLLDINIDLDLTILPETIKPHEHDYIVYRIPDWNVVLVCRIDDFEFTTIKSNSFYKANASVKDINNEEYVDKLNKQVVSEMTAILDNIGGQEKCIIEDDKYNDIITLKKVLSYLMEQYVDMFWDRKYNSFLYKDQDSRYLAYDPYLTEFLRRHNLVDLQDDVYIVVTNYDTRNETRVGYNRSIYRNLELRDITKLHKCIKVPTTFPTTTTNPFYYYGEDIAFTFDMNIDFLSSNGESVNDKVYYIDPDLIDRILNNTPLMIGEPIIDNEGKMSIVGIKDTYDNLHLPEEADYRYVTFTNVNDDDTEKDTTDLYEKTTHNNSYIFWNLIITYLNSNTSYNLLKDSNIKLGDIVSLNIKYDQESFLYTPILIYILTEYVKELTNNK